MRARLLAGALAAGALALTGCGVPPPDTALHPNLPTVRYAPLQHPFRNARLALDTRSPAVEWQRAHHARWLDPITRTPQARWVNGPQDVAPAARLARTAHRHHHLAVFVAYYVPHRGCGPGTGGAPDGAAYLRWVDELAAALRGTRSVVILEPDAVAADCFDAAHGVLLTDATRRLDRAGLYVYLDAGHPGWRSTGEMAQRLLQSGITLAEGFSVNVSNRQSTVDSFHWGRELSDLLGDREFVIDTSRNGLGAPPDGKWCNVRRQGLGVRPTTRAGLPGVAALLWIKRPGESDGRCGGETTYGFSPRQARELITGSPWASTH